MALRVMVSDNLVSILLSGFDRALCLSPDIDLHGDEIVSVQVMPRQEAKAQLGWRVGGGYWPGRLATGWFTVRGERGQLQLWDTYTDDEVLVIDTTRSKPSRVVLQHPDRDELAARIRGVIRPSAGGQASSAASTASANRVGSSNIG